MEEHTITNVSASNETKGSKSSPAAPDREQPLPDPTGTSTTTQAAEKTSTSSINLNPMKKRIATSVAVTRKGSRIQKQKIEEQRPQNLQPASARTASTSLAPTEPKFFGVRRVLATAEGPNPTENRSPSRHERGESNPLIRNLMTHNPVTLRRILSSRDVLKAVLEYPVLMKDDSPRREEGGADGRKKKRKGGPAVLTDDASPPMPNVLEELVEEDIQEEDIHFFVRDVMEEIAQLKRRQRKKSAHHNHNHEVEVDFTAAEDDTRIDEVEFENPEETKHSTETEHEFDRCDLNWLAREMERDWKDFLDGRNNTAIHDDPSVVRQVGGSSDSDEINQGSNKLASSVEPIYKYRYKARICMFRGPRCHLGIFESARRAAEEYDRHAIGRRSLGKKYLEEFEMRRRVKCRRAAYEENKRAVMIDKTTPMEAARRSHTAAATVFASLKPQGYLATDKVMFPDLNFPGWNATRGEDGRVVSGPVAIGDKYTEEVVRLGDLMMSYNTPEAALVEIVDEHISPTHFGDAVSSLPGDGLCPISTKLTELEGELASLTQKMMSRSNDIGRLIRLEKSFAPFQKEHHDICEGHNQLYQALSEAEENPWN